MNIKDEICDEEVGGGEVDCDVLLEEHNFKVPSLVNSSLNQMFCIEAPAKVENLNNFVRCCGGIRSLESILFTPKSRLQFKFRPDDPNSVPLFSGRKSSTDLVVKVRRKKKPDGTHDYKFETVGVIDTTFHFEDKICDLQLLPTSSDIRNELLKSDFILNGPASKVTVDKDNSVTIMKHFFYSRFTTPRAVFFEMSEQSKQEPNNPDVICQLRKPRRMFGSFVKWESETVPESLSEEHKSRIPEATSNDPVLIKIKELFDQRPICDIDVPEVKQIIAENDGQEVECTEKDGWCSKDAIDRIRKIMVEIANKTCYEATGSHFDPKITLSDLEQAETEDQLMIEDENF
ncbi:General transcription factor 3C polypeptide 5 [Tyrophagus putrescentiae]|nr:General transcription factor 3C polypeptide 5 [Tyrophagus putrescentiae]